MTFDAFANVANIILCTYLPYVEHWVYHHRKPGRETAIVTRITLVTISLFTRLRMLQPEPRLRCGGWRRHFLLPIWISPLNLGFNIFVLLGIFICPVDGGKSGGFEIFCCIIWQVLHKWIIFLFCTSLVELLLLLWRDLMHKYFIALMFPESIPWIRSIHTHTHIYLQLRRIRDVANFVWNHAAVR